MILIFQEKLPLKHECIFIEKASIRSFSYTSSVCSSFLHGDGADRFHTQHRCAIPSKRRPFFSTTRMAAHSDLRNVSFVYFARVPVSWTPNVETVMPSSVRVTVQSQPLL